MDKQSKLYFLHSPKIRQKAMACFIGGICLFLLYFANPIRHPQEEKNMEIFLWVFNAFLVFSLIMAGVIWKSADSLERAVLPDATTWTGPNKIPRSTRIVYLFVSSVLIVYAAHGLSIDDIYIPGHRGSTGAHYHGLSAWFMACAIFSAAANMISVLVDHFDRRNNEIKYAHFAAFCGWLAAAFFLMGWIVQ
jgi:hypothetical protein